MNHWNVVRRVNVDQGAAKQMFMCHPTIRPTMLQDTACKMHAPLLETPTCLLRCLLDCIHNPVRYWTVVTWA